MQLWNSWHECVKSSKLKMSQANIIRNEPVRLKNIRLGTQGLHNAWSHQEEFSQYWEFTDNTVAEHPCSTIVIEKIKGASKFLDSSLKHLQQFFLEFHRFYTYTGKFYNKRNETGQSLTVCIGSTDIWGLSWYVFWSRSLPLRSAAYRHLLTCPYIWVLICGTNKSFPIIFN